MGQLRVLSLADAQGWCDVLDRFPCCEVAHSPRFARVYEEKGDGKAECLLFESNGGRVLYPFIRRPLGALGFVPADLAQLTDIITPYCYGGFVHDAEDGPAARNLLVRFRAAFEGYARETGIVSEFVRFHPLLGNHQHCDDLFDAFILHRDNIVVDLSRSVDDLLGGCRQTVRRYIRRAKESGRIHVRLEPTPSSAVFQDLYSRTMDRHGQRGYLNFQRDYFDILFRNLADDLLFFTASIDGEVVAGALFLRSGDTLDYFLGGSKEEHFHHHPNHLLFYECMCWGQRQGLKCLHLGGGRDSLYYFKTGFSKETVPFYVGHRIHDPDAYDALVALRAASPPVLRASGEGFFPGYRQGFE
ncbi:MAG: lipid II:glycine glycyltransferase FemX [Rhodospirillales bacterium]